MKSTPEYRQLIRVKGESAKLSEIEKSLMLNRSFKFDGNGTQSKFDNSRMLHRRELDKPVQTPFKSPTKNELSQSLRDYTSGTKSTSDFRKALEDNGVKINPFIDKLLRKNDCGDSVSFLDFGKEIFK